MIGCHYLFDCEFHLWLNRMKRWLDNIELYIVNSYFFVGFAFDIHKWLAERTIN